MRIPEMIPKQKFIAWIIVSFIIGIIVGSGTMTLTNLKDSMNETQAMIELDTVKIGDRVILECEKGSDYSKCGIQGEVRSYHSGDFAITWSTGSLTKHCHELLSHGTKESQGETLQKISFENFVSSKCE